jgi:EmrB/QacA subfamily drug resistance transporter
VAKKLEQVPYKWVALGTVAVGTFMATVDAGAVRVVLPDLTHAFGVSADVVLWVWLAYLLVSTGLMLTLGQAGDTLGRKRLYATGVGVFTVGLGLCSVAQSLPQLIFFRAIQAVGAAMTVAMANAIVTASFPSGERGRALGIMGAVVSAGLLVGPVFGGLCLEWLGWQSVFYLRAPVGALAIALSWPLLRPDATASPDQSLDLRGATYLFAGLACLLIAINRGQSLGWESPLVIGLSLAALVSLLLFLRTERHAPNPVVDLTLFCNRLFSAATTSHTLLYISTTGVNFVLPFYLIDALHVSPSRTGLLLATLPAVRVLTSPPAGRLSDRTGTLLLCTVGMVALCGGLLLLRGLGIRASTMQLLLCLVVLGLGMGLFAPPNTSAIMGSVSRARLGTASAMVATSRQIGMSLGLGLGGTLFAHGRLSSAAELKAGGAAPEMVETASTVSGFQEAVLGAAIVAVFALLSSSLRGRLTG